MSVLYYYNDGLNCNIHNGSFASQQQQYQRPVITGERNQYFSHNYNDYQKRSPRTRRCVTTAHERVGQEQNYHQQHQPQQEYTSPLRQYRRSPSIESLSSSEDPSSLSSSSDSNHSHSHSSGSYYYYGDEYAITTACPSRTPFSPFPQQQQHVHLYQKRKLPEKYMYVAVDCEMVGTLTGDSVLARVVVLDFKGRLIYESYCKPDVTVTDYRTAVSGITAADLEHAPSIEIVQAKVQKLITNKIVIGHGLENDFKCLNIHNHPWQNIRDTAYYEPFMRRCPETGCQVPRKLRDLAAEKLFLSIQDTTVAPHSPFQDALTALELYKRHRPRWEACILRDWKAAKIQQQHQLRRQLPFHSMRLCEQPMQSTLAPENITVPLEIAQFHTLSI